MKAVLHRAYGPPARALAIEEVAVPRLTDEQILVRVRASSINSVDCRTVRADPIVIRFMGGLRRPKFPAFGGDVAGVVEAVGASVSGLKPGDEVFGIRKGALAEYVAGVNFVLKPVNLTMEQAAAMPTAGITALQAVRDHGSVQPGHQVLVNGAGGGVGTFAVQIAKALGATVTGVTSADKQELVRTIGADMVLDREHEDYTRNAGAYDVIIDISGDRSFGATRRALGRNGRLVVVGAHRGVLRRVLLGDLRRKLLKQDIRFFSATVSTDDLSVLRELGEAGNMSPVIDRTFSFEETAAAVAYAERQQAAGKVVVAISD